MHITRMKIDSKGYYLPKNMGLNIYNVQIQIRISFGMVNSINTHLRLKFKPHNTNV